MQTTQIFDGHNDTLLSLRQTGRSFFESSERGHVDLPRARAGGMTGGFFAIWVPDPEHNPLDGDSDDPDVSAYTDVNLMPPRMQLSTAQLYALESLATVAKLERECGGALAIVRTAQDIIQNASQGIFSVEIHLEGAEPIDPQLNTLEAFYLAGVRSIGPVWSRSNAFAHGVPFQFPASPDTGPGLTDSGKALVSACNELGILIDLSHLNEAGFWDVARLSTHPLVATHSGVHAISPSTRNLTDKQLDAIRDSGGIVGVNFHVGFLHPDGSADAASTTVGAIANHVDYLCGRIGSDKVALGSDFDGATMPGDLKDAAGLPKLIMELSKRGYDQQTLNMIGIENWLRVFDRTWRN
ncbi:dipeptidase [soil metagenome]